jgi:hypothetical protein
VPAPPDVVNVHVAPRPRSLELISGLLRASVGDQLPADEEQDEIRQMQEELAQLRAQHAKLPIHLRGRLPPPPPRHKPKFLGDYGQRHAGHALRYVSVGPTRGGGSRSHTSSSSSSSSKGGYRRPVTSHARWLPASAMPKAGETPEEHACTEWSGEQKRLGAAEDGAPKGQAHAGEEGRAVAARAVLLSVRPSIEEGKEESSGGAL